MAEFKPGTAGGHDTTTSHFATQHTGSVAGELIDVNQPVELRADGRLYKASGAGTFLGVSPRTVKVANQALTVHGLGQRFHASDAGSLVIGKTYYLGATAGQISDAATAVDAQGAFVAVSAYDLTVVRIGKLA
ncbi:hypothetical protein [Deinococcus radiotolerans]|uniref:Uncharacterized protein n=1 Tax=Deinococcus radiotolerans TaxID=1309407 RepID=A0ABQ2FQ42_9DEIO|nr:hypothetical protein [Deinococcus radiotolerans]GGL15812.1 hypothetical protein GCM10010844_38410 [Deinococcus radiotolerans]